MTTRREVLASGLATAALPGCVDGYEERNVNADGLPAVPVDIHNHVFNATDIPATGFVTQVLLRDPETPVPGGPSVARSLVGLIIDIILSGRQTPTASEEFRMLEGLQDLRMRDDHDVLRQDRRAVETGLRVLEDKVNAAGQARANVGLLGGDIPPPNSDEVLFSRLAAESGVAVNPVGASGNLLRSESERGQRSRQIAAAIYSDTDQSTAPTFKTLSERARPDQSLAQNLRWAGLLTRSRTDILGELLRLYAHQADAAETDEAGATNGIRVFSPSLVDFTYWLQAGQERDADRSGRDILDQIATMSRIAKLQRRALLLPFAPFCPLRAAHYRKRAGPDWLQEIKAAVETQGFSGVKLYPPMGFLPIGNDRLDAPGTRKPRAMRDLEITGQELDAELRALYAWCVEEDVPIKSHGNNSLGADACTGQNAAAANWQAVLETPGWSGLRVNIAHFGGFDEELDPTSASCPRTGENYEAQAARLVGRHDNFYVDLGYWTNVTGSNASPPNLRVKARMEALLAQEEKLKTRLMYGSDWSMIGREEQHARYYNDVRNMLGEIGLEPKDQAGILGGNALRYLGLDRRGKQYDRLSRFFGDAEQFRTVMALIRPQSRLAAFARDLLTRR